MVSGKAVEGSGKQLKPNGIKFNHAGHIKLWNWLAETGETKKSLWPGWEHSYNLIKNDNCCFACQYVLLKNQGRLFCSRCPLIWPDGKKCTIKYSLYDAWSKCFWLYKRKDIARAIRDLPVKEGVETI